jgi:hypothetical protein
MPYRILILALLLKAFLPIVAQNYLGDTSKFLFSNEAVNLNATGAGTAHLYQVQNNFENTTFKFELHYNYNPSASNFFQFYFAPTDSAQNQISKNALLFTVGENGNNDALCIWEWEGSKWTEKQRLGNTWFARTGKIILDIKWINDSIDLHLQSANNHLKAKYFYPKQGQKNYLQYGLFTKFTATNSKRLSNIKIHAEEWILDDRALEIVGEVLVYPNKAVFTVNKNVKEITIENSFHPITSYQIKGKEITVYWDSLQNSAPIFFTLQCTDDYYFKHTLNIQNNWYKTQKKDLIITELLLKPNTQIHPNLPAPFVEIYNSSEQIINLANIKLIVRDTEIILPAKNIYPKQFITLSAHSYTNQNHITTNFPSLLQSGTEIEIWAINQLIDYWHAIPDEKDLLKNLGGFSLNRRGDGYCFQNESFYSNHKSGATMALADWKSITTDLSYSINKILHLQDSLFAIQTQNYISDLTIQNIKIFSKNNTYKVHQIKGNTIWFYYSDSSNIADMHLFIEAENCTKKIKIEDNFTLAIPKNQKPTTIAINEIMFDAIHSQNNYIEFFIADTGCWKINDFRLGTIENSLIESICMVGNPNELICGGEYFVVTGTSENLVEDFANINPKCIAQTTSFISLRNTGNTIGLWFKDGELLDSVSYHENLHHTNIQNTKGISLEKKSDGKWGSATWGQKGTPTRKNSGEFTKVDNIINKIQISSLVVPQIAELQDLKIEISELDADYTLSLNLWDSNGILMQNIYNQFPIQSNEKLAVNSLNFPPGIYVLQVEIINLETAQKNSFKKSITFN